MRWLRLPYGKGELFCNIHERRPFAVLHPRNYNPHMDATALIQNALEHPFGSPRLATLAMGKRKIVIVTSDHTRPLPSYLTLPPMLQELRTGAPDADITILIALGSHRPTTREEMVLKFGEDIVNKEKIINHDPHNKEANVFVGILPSGGKLYLNRLAVEADILVADGFIEPHQFAGFSGGRKSILPGIASYETIMGNHNAVFTVHPCARPGNLRDNPVHQDMLSAAHQAKLAFILNVALGENRRVVGAFAGDMEQAHGAGCDFVEQHASVQAAMAPIVIASNGGYPMDQNIYQATKSILTAALCCEDNGIIIGVNECRDGHGGEDFIDMLSKAPSLQSLADELSAKGKENTVPDQWVVQLIVSVLLKHRVIMVTSASEELVTSLRMEHAATLQEALAMADRYLKTEDAPVTVIPDAVSVIVKPKS